jgi:hypothetical protein
VTRLLLTLLALSTLACMGAPPPSTDTAVVNDQDVRGVYAVTWSDQFTIRLDIGGAVQEATSDGSDVVTFSGPDGEPLELDVAAWCADPAVNCPSEAWPSRLAIDETDPTTVMDVHSLRAWDADVPSTVVEGLVDHQDDTFLFGLDGGSGSDGSCGAVALSLAGGTFTYDGAQVTGVADGQVAVGWLGVCAWSGLVVAATLSVETTYTAVREGDLPEVEAGDTADTADSG